MNDPFSLLFLEPVFEIVAHFEAYDKGYYAILEKGARLDIVRVWTSQPPIKDPARYFSYMLVQTLERFYLLRQEMLECRPQDWEVLARTAGIECDAALPYIISSRLGELIEMAERLDRPEETTKKAAGD